MALNEVNLPPLLLPEAVTGQVERSLERLRQWGEGYQTLAEQKARQKVLRKKSFLSAELSGARLKSTHHVPQRLCYRARRRGRREPCGRAGNSLARQPRAGAGAAMLCPCPCPPTRPCLCANPACAPQVLFRLCLLRRALKFPLLRFCSPEPCPCSLPVLWGGLERTHHLPAGQEGPAHSSPCVRAPWDPAAEGGSWRGSREPPLGTTPLGRLAQSQGAGAEGTAARLRRCPRALYPLPHHQALRRVQQGHALEMLHQLWADAAWLRQGWAAPASAFPAARREKFPAGAESILFPPQGTAGGDGGTAQSCNAAQTRPRGWMLRWERGAAGAEPPRWERCVLLSKQGLERTQGHWLGTGRR